MEYNHKLVVSLPDGTPFTMYEAFPKQAEFHQSDVSKLVALGSRNSGKSLMLRMDAHMRALACPGSNLILIRKTYKELLKSHVFFQGLPWGSLDAEMKLLGGSYHVTDHICHYPNGSKLFLSYIGHENDALNLLSAEFLAAYFDEISTIPWDFFIKLSSSVRVNKRNPHWKAVIRAATNPFGVSAGEVRHYFVDKDVDPEEDPDYYPNDWGRIWINMEDNPHIDLETYRRQLAPLPPYLKKAWLEGEFSDESALFDFWPRKEGNPYHVLEDIDLQKIIQQGRIFRAIDLGWAPDPTYILWIAHLGKRYVAIHEKVLYKTVISDVARIIKEEDIKLGLRGYDDEGPTKRVAMTFIDPSADIHTGAEIRTNKGIFEAHDIPAECSINDRSMFASVIHQALGEEVDVNLPRLQVYRGTKTLGCPYLVRSLPNMRMDPKRPLYMANHPHDHPAVTLAYFLISHASNEHSPYTERKVPRWLIPKSQRNQKWVLGTEAVRRRDDN